MEREASAAVRVKLALLRCRAPLVSLLTRLHATHPSYHRPAADGSPARTPEQAQGLLRAAKQAREEGGPQRVARQQELRVRGGAAALAGCLQRCADAPGAHSGPQQHRPTAPASVQHNNKQERYSPFLRNLGFLRRALKVEHFICIGN